MLMRHAFEGIWIPLITPFRNGKLDLRALQRLTDHLVGQGIAGVVACGTTGEAATLDDEEQTRVLNAIMEVVDGRCGIVMGVSGNDTRVMVEAVAKLDAYPLEGLLIAPPYYLRPSQAGIVAHYRALAAASQHSILLYDIPARCGVALEDATIEALAEDPQFAAVKICSGSPHQLLRLVAQGQLSVMSGDDALLLNTLLNGGSGAITASAHVRADLYVDIVKCVRQRRLDDARAIFAQLLPLIELLFSEPNPAPIKALLSVQGWIADELRLPLLPASAECRRKLEIELDRVMSI